MALVNPNIAMSFRQPEFQPRNALAEYAQVQQIMGGQRQAEMADMQIEELRRKERAISQIQAAAVKHGGPTNRREIAQAYIKSGVPEFMKIGLTMDQDLDELEAFDRIMGGGAGGAARAAPSAAAAAAGATAPGATPTFPIAGKDVRMGTLGTGTFDSARISDIGLAQPGLSRMSAAEKAELAASAGPGGIQSMRLPQGPHMGTESMIADILRAPPEEQAAIERALPSMKIPGVSAGRVPPFSQLSRDLLSPETRNALSYGYAPTSLTAPAESVNALAPPPENVNQLAAAGAAPAGAAPAGTAQTDPVAELRAKRDAFIRRGTARALQAARSLDADIALLSRTTAVAPGSTVIGPDGKEVYRAGAAPSSIATLEAEIAALKKAGATEDSLQVQSRRAAIQQASGQSTDLIRNYNAAVAEGFKGTIFDYERQIKQAGRAVTPPTPAAPVAVIDSATGNTIYVSREEALRNRMTPAGQGVSLTPKQMQTFEAKYPQATAAVKTFESKADRLAADLETLANHPGLSGISGLIYGRTPALTAEARQAEALYDSIIARGGFQELQDMRAASPTGGALGPVSNTENQYLRDAFAPIKRTQDTPDLKQALLGAAQATKDSKQRVREAYDLTYEYRTRRGEGAAPAAPAAAPAAPRAGEVRQGYRFKGGDPADQKNWEKQ